MTLRDFNRLFQPQNDHMTPQCTIYQQAASQNHNKNHEKHTFVNFWSILNISLFKMTSKVLTLHHDGLIKTRHSAPCDDLCFSSDICVQSDKGCCNVVCATSGAVLLPLPTLSFLWQAYLPRLSQSGAVLQENPTMKCCNLKMDSKR